MKILLQDYYMNGKGNSKVLIKFLLNFRQSGDVLFFLNARRLRGYTATAAIFFSNNFQKPSIVSQASSAASTIEIIISSYNIKWEAGTSFFHTLSPKHLNVKFLFLAKRRTNFRKRFLWKLVRLTFIQSIGKTCLV